MSRDDMQDLMQGLAPKEDLLVFKSELVTKEDLKGFATKGELSQEMNKLAARHQQDFEKLIQHLWFIWMGLVGANILMTIAIIVVVKYLF